MFTGLLFNGFFSTSLNGLHLNKVNSLTLTAYSESDWAGCLDDRQQPTVARSSAEAEYRSIALTAAAELCWIVFLSKEIGLSNLQPTLWCDNLGATFLAVDPVSHARTKHIEIGIHFVCDHIPASGQIDHDKSLNSCMHHFNNVVTSSQLSNCHIEGADKINP